jgi:uncharacterized protein (DUF2062 family)
MRKGSGSLDSNLGSENPDLRHPANRFFKRIFLIPILEMLRQGITPEKIALSIALGIILGVTPMLGSTTLLCFLAAALLRLNLPAIQLINFIVYPFQIALLIPFARMGQWLFRAKSTTPTLAQIVSLTRQNVWTAIGALWTVTMHAVVAWLILGSLALPLLYWVLANSLSRLGSSPEAETA